MSTSATRTGDERELYRVRRQLAALIVSLLLLLLLVLGTAVYLTMQSALLGPARQALSERAHAQLYYLSELGREAGDSESADEARAEGEVGGVGITYIGPELKLLAGSTDPFGKAIPDPVAARLALRTRTPRYSTRDAGTQTYLIYTLPSVHHGRLLGAIQTITSERQYSEGLQSLLSVLVIVGGLGVLASAGISLLVVRRALLPIRRSMRRQRDFVADAAHELRTPLAIMRTSAELALTDGSHEEEEDALEQVLSEGNHLMRLVEDLSLLARADSGALALSTESVSLNTLVAETSEGLEILAEQQDVRLEVTAPAGILSVQGDAGKLRQLLLILLDNALKHTPPGGRVTVSLDSAGGRARLQVRDTGPGIPQEALPHIFDRFYRASRARESGEGAGLGLAIGRWIAEAHGGKLSAANAPGGGAVLTLTLPISSVQKVLPTAREPTGAR